MPVVIAFFIRQFVIIAVQLGIFALAERVLVPLLNKAIEKAMTVFGVNEDTAKDILANEILTTVEALGLTVALSKARLPLKLAEKLGFTSKGFAKRKLTPAVEQKVAAEKLKAKGVAVDEAVVFQEVAKTVAATRGISLDKVSSIANLLLKILGIPIAAGLVVINTIDFAAWPTSIYADTFQKFFAFFGLKPDQNASNSSVLSKDTWDRVWGVYKNLGAVGISDPYKGVDVPFTRDNLIALVDKVAAAMIAERGKATLGWIIGATQGFMIMEGEVTTAKINSAFAGIPYAPKPPTTPSTPTPTTKVFSGILSQGVVGKGLVFTPRQDDLIESVQELKEAAANNLAPFLAALPSKVIYEVKVVNSITTADGFKQTGTTQKVQSGYDALGKPKYKTVTNKFAVLNVYVFTEKRVRTKVSSIVLGPVDSVKLKVGVNDLTELSLALPKMVTTTDVDEITEIQTSTPTTITAPPSAPVGPPREEKEYLRVVNGEIFDVGKQGGKEFLQKLQGVALLEKYAGYAFDTGKIYQPEIVYLAGYQRGTAKGASERQARLAFEASIKSDPNKIAELLNKYKLNTEAGFKDFADEYKTFYNKSFAPVAGTVPADQTPLDGGQTLGGGARTLFEWYQQQGQAVPSIAARALIYAGFGLGQASYYTGTAEQNTKLLNALKSQ